MEIKAITAGTYTWSENEGVRALHVDAHMTDCSFDPDAAVRLALAVPEKIEGRMADVLYSACWCRPDFGKDFTNVPERTQGLLWKNTDSTYCFVLPMAHGDYVTSLGSVNGELTATVASFCEGLTDCSAYALVTAEGSDPYAIMSACAKEAARLLNNGLRVRGERRYPEIFEYLGWCSWDALEIWVNEAEILEKCEEFRTKGIPVRWAIFDDMWADVEWTQKLPKFTPHSTSFGVMHASKMRDWEADPERFPNGLAGCIAKVKENYGMKVGIWHPTPGYWSGLTADGPAAQKQSDAVTTLPNGKIMPDLSSSAKAYAFYSRMHRFFREAGAEFMKIDHQSFLRANYRNVIPAARAARALHDGIEASVGEYFDSALINCMCMASENMFSRTNTAITRCSDDFQPENRAWFAKHILQCAYNGLVQGQYYYSDWDMWWSNDEQAKKNSVLRALSGGPVYVSDRIGRSCPEIFAPLCFSDGRLLRPDNVAVPTPDCLVTNMTEETRSLKVFNMAGETAYVAAFNLHTDGSAVCGSVSAGEIPGLTGDRFLLYEYFTKEWRVVTKNDVITLTLKDADDFRLFSITPIVRGVAVIGDAEKFISVRAVAACGKNYVRTVEGGLLKLYSEAPITRAEGADGNPLPLEKDGDMYTVRLTGKGAEVYFA